jgi:asparagine synthetase B (glutamine-hydrolysing)
MSALLGSTGNDGDGSDDRWGQALERAASRCAPVSELARSAGVRIALGGIDASAYAANDAWIVALDGFVDGAAAGSGAAEMLAQIQRDGIASVHRRTGCYALVAVERPGGTVHLVRDRFGTRPLHYARTAGGFCWASEIKCLAPLLPHVASRFEPILWRLEEPARHYHVFPLLRMLEELRPRADLVLYGEGADTLFGSAAAAELERFAARQALLRPIPVALRRMLGAALGSVGTQRARYVSDLLLRAPRTCLHRLRALEHFTDPGQLVALAGREAAPSREIEGTFVPPDADLSTQLQALDLYSEVQCHLDTMDRLSAPTGVQVAVPFLSAPVADLAFSLPREHRRSGAFSKPILRALGARHFPSEWMYRPKYGFDTPTAAWLRGPLRPYLDRLCERRTLARGLFRPEVIERLTLDRDWELLWTAACLETLLRMFVDGEAPPSRRSPRSSRGRAAGAPSALTP